MIMKLNYITIFEGYDPSTRFETLVDKVSRTIQDAVVDIPSLLEMFNGRLDDLFNQYNNGLVFESTIGVFVDELNAKELEEFRKKQADLEKLEADKKEQERLFEQWKAEKAKEVLSARENVSSEPAPSSQSAPSSE